MDGVLEDLIDFDKVWHVDVDLHILGYLDNLFNDSLNFDDLWYVYDLLNYFLDDLRHLHNPLNNLFHWHKFLDLYLHLPHILLDYHFSCWQSPRAFPLDYLFDDPFDFLNDCVL